MPGFKIIRPDNPKIPTENLPEEIHLTDRLSSLSLNNSNTFHYPSNAPNTSQDKIQTNQIHQKSSEDTLQAKLKELKVWKKEQIYVGGNDEGHDCILLRWALKKLVDKKSIKTRL